MNYNKTNVKLKTTITLYTFIGFSLHFELKLQVCIQFVIQIQIQQLDWHLYKKRISNNPAMY